MYLLFNVLVANIENKNYVVNILENIAKDTLWALANICQCFIDVFAVENF